MKIEMFKPGFEFLILKFRYYLDFEFEFRILFLFAHFPNYFLNMLGVARAGVQVEADSGNYFGEKMLVHFTLDLVNIVRKKF